MDSKDAQDLSNVRFGLSKPQASHVLEDRTMDCELHKDSQAGTVDVVQSSLNDTILHHPSDPLEDSVIKNLSAKTLLHTEELSSLAEGLAECSIDKDDLMVKFKQRIEEALEPLRAPVALVFQRRWEAERKRRQDLLARQEKKLVLRRKMIQQLKRRRGGRVRRSTRRVIVSSSSRSPSDAVHSQLTMGS